MGPRSQADASVEVRRRLVGIGCRLWGVAARAAGAAARPAGRHQDRCDLAQERHARPLGPRYDHRPRARRRALRRRRGRGSAGQARPGSPGRAPELPHAFWRPSRRREAVNGGAGLQRLHQPRRHSLLQRWPRQRAPAPARCRGGAPDAGVVPDDLRRGFRPRARGGAQRAAHALPAGRQRGSRPHHQHRLSPRPPVPPPRQWQRRGAGPHHQAGRLRLHRPLLRPRARHRGDHRQRRSRGAEQGGGGDAGHRPRPRPGQGRPSARRGRPTGHPRLQAAGRRRPDLPGLAAAADAHRRARRRRDGAGPARQRGQLLRRASRLCHQRGHLPHGRRLRPDGGDGGAPDVARQGGRTP